MKKSLIWTHQNLSNQHLLFLYRKLSPNSNSKTSSRGVASPINWKQKKQPGKLWKNRHPCVSPNYTKLDITSWNVVSCCIFAHVLLFVVSAPLPKCAAIALGSPSCQANGETTYHQLKWDSYRLNYELYMTDSVSLKSETLDALTKIYICLSLFLLMCVTGEIYISTTSTWHVDGPTKVFYQYMPSVASTFLISTFSKVHLDVKNTAVPNHFGCFFLPIFSKQESILMIVKLWKVSWSTSQCIFYVICSIEWSPTLKFVLFSSIIHSLFVEKHPLNIPQTNNMRQTNNKIDEIWTTWNQKPVLFPQQNQSHKPLTALFFVATLRSKWFF